MSLRFLIIVVVLVLIVAGLPYLMHQASRPQVFTMNSVENTLWWTDGPDVALNADSLRKLNREIEQLTRHELSGELNSYRVVSIGKRQVEVMYFGSKHPSVDLEAKVEAYVQMRMVDLAKAQGKS